MYKWLANQVCYSKEYDEHTISFLKTRCRQDLLNSIDLNIWYIINEIEDEEYNEETNYFYYFLRIKFGRYKDE